METPPPSEPSEEHESADADNGPGEAHADVFARWGSGPLLLFAFGCLLLYEIWIAVLWNRDSELGVWGLALAPLLGVLLPVALVIRTTRVPVREQLWLYGLSRAQWIGVMLAATGAVPVCYAAGALNAAWTPPDPEYYELFQALAPSDFPSAIAGFVAVVICVPLGEEILFRFLLLGVLARHVHAVAAVVAAGVLFAAAHAAPFVLLPIGILGIVLGLLTVWSRTLTAAWIGHAVFNLFGYIELCVTGDAETTAVEEFVLKPWVLVMGTLMLVVGLALLRTHALASVERDDLRQSRAQTDTHAHDDPPTARDDT